MPPTTAPHASSSPASPVKGQPAPGECRAASPGAVTRSLAPPPTTSQATAMAQTLCMRLLTEGHVAAFAEAFELLGLGEDADHGGSGAGADGGSAHPVVEPDARAIARTKLRASPAHVQRLCVHLAAREDALLRTPPTANVVPPALYTATRTLALFLLEALPHAATEYARRALDLALAMRAVPPTPATPSTERASPATPAASVDPETAVLESQVTMADSLAMLDMHAEAIAQYKHALSIPEAVDRLVISAHRLVQAEERAGRWDMAAAQYLDVLACISPDHPRATQIDMELRQRLGLVRLNLGDLKTAETELGAFLDWAHTSPPPPVDPAKLAADIGAASLALAECREQAGDLETAAKVLTDYLDAAGSTDHDSTHTQRATVLLGNLLNRLDRVGHASELLATAQGDAAACQLGIARGAALFDEFLAAVNTSTRDVYAFMDQIHTRNAA
ncbi:hypothetical protein H9P43_001454 [Blastocladiella emersonii ATCC 22665]|nr:hypothetical protein H9P43_001454 [Blastocladiella emersonii ATCC 22665]